MKRINAFTIGLALAAALASCSTPSAPPSLSTSADAYFFQPDLTQIYTYSQDQASQTDTVTYQTSLVNPSNPYESYLQLKTTDPAATSGVLYYFKSVQASDGSSICLLANTSTSNGFVALKGTLDLGAEWYADSEQKVQAIVVGKYAEYFLPGRQVHYEDVIVVKYTDKTSTDGSYTVRYFARNYGLIFERTIGAPGATITDLQLLSRQGSSNTANPDQHHDRWYNANGRYIAHMREDDLLKK